MTRGEEHGEEDPSLSFRMTRREKIKMSCWTCFSISLARSPSCGLLVLRDPETSSG
jgi:hypothetical protein